jgi:hypothetical protein
MAIGNIAGILDETIGVHNVYCYFRGQDRARLYAMAEGGDPARSIAITTCQDPYRHPNSRQHCDPALSASLG